MKKNIVQQELEMLKACKTDEERQALKDKLIARHRLDTEEETISNISDLNSEIKDVNQAINLLKANKIISLTYLSETYLNKSRSYLSQRINQNIVNGEKATLTEDDIMKIKEGLQDMSKKLYDLSLLF